MANAKRFRKFVPIFFMPLFGMVSVLFSNILIESGSYVTEQEKFGFYNGSTVIYFSWVVYTICLIYIFSLLYRPLCYNYYEYKWLKNKNRFDFIFLRGLCFFAIACVLFMGLTHGFPLLHGVDRFVYWSRQDYIFEFIYGQLFLISFLLGWLYHSDRKFSVTLFFIVMVLHILFSNKFSAIALSLFMFFLPWFFRGFGYFRIKIYVKIVFLLLMVFVPFLYMVYTVIYGVDGLEEFIDKVLSRIVLQGHMFWGTINLHDSFLFFNSEHFFNEVLGAYGANDGYYGMQNLMVEVSGEIGKRRIEQGADFTMAYPAVVYNFSGLFGIYVAQFLLVGFFSVIIFLTVKCIRNLYVLCLVPLGKIIIDIVGFFGIGDLELIVGYKFLFYFAVFVFLYMIYTVLTYKPFGSE